MMPRWHHSDSSKAMSSEHDSVKKKTLELNSRSNLFSAGLFYIKSSRHKTSGVQTHAHNASESLTYVSRVERPILP